ncbi:BZIP transcription factor 49 [Pleurostoma richardsiae]|uniref:BZIP transcription factor 49 n=1 Tax=Pleurostoma richardsiae TaxID=41990 RepID=A0AA38VNX2_9PEZI|nr:BZIP transcription factor 49 [Pleurostoma richardsiae]
MVSAFPMQQFYRQPLTVDTHAQKYFDEDDSILDDNILEHSALDSGLEMSPHVAGSRRDSFAVSSTLFSPKTEDWQSVDMQSVPSNNPFMEPQHSNNPFLRMDQHQQSQNYATQNQSWSISTSGTCTPMQQFDGLPAEFDANAASTIFHRSQMQQAQTPFSNPTNHVAMFQSVNSQSVPQSPQNDHWMGPSLKDPKRMRPSSPAIRSHNELRRGDGIRKKNARFDIPAERNLSNIDQLISQSTDEQEIKELKQQKRLLRNRQAALDSRQRKKQHTERLEDEKKQYTALIGDYEEKIVALETQMEQLLREKQQFAEYIEQMNMEKEEMVRSHTLETGELRKKVSVLTNHVQTLEGAAMSNAQAAPPPSSGFPGAPFGDMDGLTMDGPWDNMGFLNDFPIEQPEVKAESQQIVSARKQPDVALPADVEKPSTQGGLLFMLFLVGAFVLSSRSTPPIPRVSEDVRAASATLLENVLKDAGVAQAATSGSLDVMAPQPSSASWAPASAPSMPAMGSNTLDGVAPSMLSQLSDSLTQPTEEQTNEQLFSLTAAQYNGVNSQDFLQNAPAERSTSQGRRNLAEALASMRSNSKAEVYTRSLLWDQIPGDVVRTFAKMVAECNSPSSNGIGVNNAET